MPNLNLNNIGRTPVYTGTGEDSRLVCPRASACMIGLSYVSFMLRVFVFYRYWRSQYGWNRIGHIVFRNKYNMKCPTLGTQPSRCYYNLCIIMPYSTDLATLAEGAIDIIEKPSDVYRSRENTHTDTSSLNPCRCNTSLETPRGNHARGQLKMFKTWVCGHVPSTLLAPSDGQPIRPSRHFKSSECIESVVHEKV